MSRSPIPLKEILEYLKYEDAEGLVPGSVKYVGFVATQKSTKHYWSYPLNGRLAWALMDDNHLGDAKRIPAEIRAKTAPLAEHRTERPLPLPKNPWVGENRPAGSAPKWVPANQVHMEDLSYVATFMFDFDQAAEIFSARPSGEDYFGGGGPSRFFFLELARSRLARLERSDRRPDRVDLYLPEKNGVVYWDDYDQIMEPLGVPLEKAFRQACLNWRHRKPTPEAKARTSNHYQTMWIPTYKY